MGRLVRVVAGGVAAAALSVGFVFAVATAATADTPPAPVSVGSFPLGVTVNPAGTVAYVPGAFTGTVSAIDLATSSVTPIPGFSSPWDVAVTSDGSTAYVAQNVANGPSTIEIVDLATNAISGGISVNGSTDGVALSPDDDTLYAAMGPDNQLAEVDLTQSPPTVTYLPNIPAPTDVRVAADGTVYVTSATAQTLTMIQNGVVSQSQPFVAD
jgi:DNA-binding beta-propeller fold protein YncE